jgi:hypothetical protein
MKAKHALVLLVGWSTAHVALADESKIHMKEAPETMTLVANCSGCHSLDYVQMNSKFMKRATWEAEVHKMVAVMGAPVSDADQAALVEYLTREYGVAE